MIGGARDAVTDSLGTYRFTLVPPGVYQVKFQLASFRALTVDGVGRHRERHADRERAAPGRVTG